MVSAKRRAVRIFGREYTVILPSLRDPRMHVAAVLVTLQVLGQTVLGFRLSVVQVLICMAACGRIESMATLFKSRTMRAPAIAMLGVASAACSMRTRSTLHSQTSKT